MNHINCRRLFDLLIAFINHVFIWFIIYAIIIILFGIKIVLELC